MIYYLICLSSVFIASISQILLKKAALKKYPNFIREYLNVYVIVGYLMMFGSLFLSHLSYTGLELKEVAIIEPIGNIFVLIWGAIVFKEKVSIKKVVGILLILGGFLVFNI